MRSIDHDVILNAERLVALQRTSLLDTPPEEAFDRLTRLATTVLRVPVALVSLVDGERQFFKSLVGLPEPLASLRQTPLTHSFCKHVVATGEPFIVSDTRTHSIVKDYPSVFELGEMAYAGIPLTTIEGHTLGSFCVVDTRPREWTEDEIGILQSLAASVMTEIGTRHVAEDLRSLSADLQRLPTIRNPTTRSKGRTMRRRMMMATLVAALAANATSAAIGGLHGAAARGCSPDAVAAGTVCLDTYEVSVWRVPDPTTANANLVRRIRLGRATQADLAAGGATQMGTETDDYAPCEDNGQNCADDLYAVSLPSVIPASNITWFQAQEACANAGKRLPTSAEWQVGANGTPDPGPDNGTTDCNTHTASVALTGSRRGCISARGAFDMVGNLDEWVADWVPLSTECSSWGSLSDDFMCLSGASTDVGGPGALLRGGDHRNGSSAGPLAVVGSGRPFSARPFIGFRCAR